MPAVAVAAAAEEEEEDAAGCAIAGAFLLSAARRFWRVRSCNGDSGLALALAILFGFALIRFERRTAATPTAGTADDPAGGVGSIRRRGASGSARTGRTGIGTACTTTPIEEVRTPPVGVGLASGAFADGGMRGGGDENSVDPPRVVASGVWAVRADICRPGSGPLGESTDSGPPSRYACTPLARASRMSTVVRGRLGAGSLGGVDCVGATSADSPSCRTISGLGFGRSGSGVEMRGGGRGCEGEEIGRVGSESGVAVDVGSCSCSLSLSGATIGGVAIGRGGGCQTIGL